MLESTLSLWTSINTCLTPPVLFLLLNLMIGTIALTSTFSRPHNHHVNHHSMTVNHHNHHVNHHSMTVNHHNHHHQQQQQPPLIHTHLTRSPSVIQRLKSLSFYPSYFHHQQPPPLSEPKPHHHVPDAPPAAEVVHEVATLEEVFGKIVKKGNYGRQKSDNTKPTGGDLLRVPLPRKIIKKYVTDHKSAFAHFDTTTTNDDNADAMAATLPPPPPPPIGGGVDELADDFINRFRQNLRLQRLQSLYGANNNSNSK